MRYYELLTERHEDIASALAKYKDDPDIYVQFSDVHKLGIYPGSAYDTPIGIYAYPLREMYEDIANDHIPFAGDRKWVIVFRATGNIPDLSEKSDDHVSYTSAMWYRDAEQLLSKYLPAFTNWYNHFALPKDDPYRLDLLKPFALEILTIFNDDPKALPMFKNMVWANATLKHHFNYDEAVAADAISAEGAEKIKEIVTQAEAWETSPERVSKSFTKYFYNWAEAAKITTPAGHFWNATRMLATTIADSHDRRACVLWSGIMRSMGYNGFTDKMGTGLIHDNEPTQAVFFSTNGLKIVEIVPNVRKAGVIGSLNSFAADFAKFSLLRTYAENDADDWKKLLSYLAIHHTDFNPIQKKQLKTYIHNHQTKYTASDIMHYIHQTYGHVPEWKGLDAYNRLADLMGWRKARIVSVSKNKWEQQDD